jgi:hypothetical protein
MRIATQPLDVAFFIDGMPINIRSHAHSQGYTDLHFIIPESLQDQDVEVFKGPYHVEFGDFATAGDEPEPVADVHFTSAYPFTVLEGVGFLF